ncbi:hypothetical protein ACWERW_40910 [Streptomyces sp. NPDC004012]
MNCAVAARRLGFDYAVAVRTDHRVTTAVGAFTSAGLARRVPKNARARMRPGTGSRATATTTGPCSTCPPTTPPPDTQLGTPTWSSAVTATPGTLPLPLSFRRSVALATPVDVICCRWAIEEDFQLGKSACGLDQGRTACWNSWMRWTFISMSDAAVLAVTRLRATAQTTHGRLVPVSAREPLRLLRATVLPSPRRDRDHLLHRSAWRREPQYSAAEAHRRWNNVTAAAAA